MVVVLIQKEQSIMYIIMPLYRFGLFGKRGQQIDNLLPTPRIWNTESDDQKTFSLNKHIGNACMI